MRVLLCLAAAFALVAASAAYGTHTAARIWLDSPRVVLGSGFPVGKVTVTARLQGGKAVKVVRALRTGRFTARFDTPLKANGCQGVQVSAVGAGGVRAALKVPGNAKDCPPPIDTP
jgi:hypothetical protein